MHRLQRAGSQYIQSWSEGWAHFWFSPSDPTILGIIRWLAGAVILYTHVAWTRELSTFFGSASIIPGDYRDLATLGTSFSWSHFDWLPSDAWLLPVHGLALAVMVMFMVGLWTRWTGIATAILVVSYANRATGALFGLDQINSFLALYLAIGPSGAVLSVDHWLRRRQGRGVVRKSEMANISLRLIQLHLCVVYFFAGVGKLQGDTWWDGTAIWMALASNEYQTLDMTWMAHYLWCVNLMTFISLFWEVSYPFLVWSRLTRPVVLLLAVIVHLGIGLAMGMLTFGGIMIIANLAFVSGPWLRDILGLPTIEADSGRG